MATAILYSPNTPQDYDIIVNRFSIQEDAQRIAQVPIPDFTIAPRVIVYGERLYVRIVAACYLEAFVYVVPSRFINKDSPLGSTLFGKIMKERYST
jgi:hypothetical protein